MTIRLRAVATVALAAALLLTGPARAQTLAIGDGANPGSASLCPSGAATNLDAFTLQATVAADVVTRITVQLVPAGSWVNVGLVEILNSVSAVIGSAVPGGDQVNVYVGSLAIPTSPASTFTVRITPKTHAAMPAPNAGQQYATTGTVVSIASNNPRTGVDTGSGTVTIDNLAPSEIAWTGVSTTATSIQLNWATATNVVVLRKQGGPVNDSPAEGTTTYVAGNTIGTSTVACAGSMALCNSTPLTTGTAYYFEVFTYDACGNYSLGAPIGPLFPTGTNEGSLVANTTVPVVGIINPIGPATVTSTATGPAFRVQVRAFSRPNGSNAAQQLTAVRLKAATPGQTFTTSCTNAVADYPINLAVNANYPSSSSVVAGANNYGIYEANVMLARGPYTLRACATNATNTVLSGMVGINVNDGSPGFPRGDGNLLVRDNGGQLCNDCHDLPTHSSESVGNKYGSWFADCRDCHTPHSTSNVELIRKQITPPGVNGQQPPRTVIFSNRTATGYNAAGGVNSVVNGTFANGDATGPCQVCHTRTTYYRSDGSLTGHNASQACTGCHLHTKGMKASCTTCHGAKGAYTPITGADPQAAYAPPTAADGTNTLIRVGAHQKHVNGNGTTATYRTNPIFCADCHPIPNTHNGTRDAAWSVLATTTVINGNTLVVAPTPAAGNNAYSPTWEGTPTCTNACHGANIPSNAAKPAPSWTGGALTCASCHGAPPLLASPSTLNQNHPQNTTCATCHGAGYVNGGPLAAGALATHINGTLNRITSGCTSCHGELGAPGVTRAVSLVKAAPGASLSANSYDTTGLAIGNSVGAHEAHLVGVAGTLRWRSAAILCTDCHVLPPSDSDVTHATGAGTSGARATLSFSSFANGNAFETKVAAYSPRYTCSNTYCHDPKSADTAASQVNAPLWGGVTTQAQCGSCHGLPPTTAAHPANTSCGSCHPGYTVTAPTSASTIAAVNALAHINGQQDGGGESGGGSPCSGCHATIVAMMTTGTNRKHSLVGWTDTSTDAGGAWGAATTLDSILPANRTCVNMCHGDHPHTLTSPVTATHQYNLVLDPSSTATRAAGTLTSATRTATDFDSTANTGMCTKCHVKPISTGRPTIVDATFGASAHDFTNTISPAVTWEYNMHDSGKFARNCTKCHAGTTEGNTPSVPSSTTNLTAVHGQTNNSLLAGDTHVNNTPANFICYNCHGSGAATAGTTNSNRSGKNISGEAAYAFSHPVTTDNKHDSFAEANAVNGTLLSGTNRHVNCMDCHNPHAGQAVAGATARGSVTTWATGTAPNLDTITDSTKAWAANQWKGYQVRTLSGTGAGQSSAIYGNAGNTLSVKFTTALAAGATYVIIPTGTTNGNAASPAVAGAWGLNPTFPAQPTPTSYNDAAAPANAADDSTRYTAIATWGKTTAPTLEGQICIKCHSYYAYGAAPPSTPSGLPNSSTSGWVNTAGGAMPQSDLANQFNPKNAGHHAVFARGNNQPVRANYGQATITAVTNASWPKYSTAVAGDTVAISNGVATFAGAAALPTVVLPGWYIFVGSDTLPVGTAAAGTATSGFLEITSITSPTSFAVRAENGAGGWNTTLTIAANANWAVTAGLGNNFVPPWGPWSTLSCSDCHASDVATDPFGPHGSGTKWMLRKAENITFAYWTGAAVATLAQVPDANDLCLNCHRRDIYGDYNFTAPANMAYSRQSHPIDAGKNHSLAYRSNWGISCMNCHGGARAGTIHGTNFGQGVAGSAGSYSGKRLLAGSSWYGVTRSSTAAAGACWTKGATDSVDNCGHSHGGVAFLSGTSGKANYDYDTGL